LLKNQFQSVRNIITAIFDKTLVKTTVCLLFTIISVHSALGQVDTTPPFRRFPVLPPLMLTQLNNTQITKENLKKNQPVLLMYFSPDCDHCKHQIQDMLGKMTEFKKIQIVMATYRSIEQMREFYHNYKLRKYSNIKIGRDTKFLLPPFFRIRNLPFMALYDKKGNLITTFEGNVSSDTLVAAFRNGH
jgi:thioredoxin-related protein